MNANETIALMNYVARSSPTSDTQRHCEPSNALVSLKNTCCLKKKNKIIGEPRLCLKYEQ